MIYVHGIERSLKDSLQFHLHLILAICIENSCSLTVRQLNLIPLKANQYSMTKQVCVIFGDVLPIPSRGDVFSLKF